MTPMMILFLIVFVDLVGFGIMVPLLPFYVERVGAGPEIITITLGLYSLFQFVAAPIWGKLSDRYGRKPILAWALSGFVVSYLILGFADSLAMVVASRVFGGLMAGNISAAFAYVADITTPETRAKGMGMVGAAFGLGFIFGPVIGGVLAGSDIETANFLLPALVAASLTTVALLGVIFVLPESLSQEVRDQIRDRPKILVRLKIKAAFNRRALTLIVLIGFGITMAWALLETTLALWANSILDLGPRDIGLLLTYVGIIGVIIQGGMIGPLTKRFGEQVLVGTAVCFLFGGYGFLAAAQDWTFLIVAMTFLAIGNALANPSLSSLVSKEADETERGSVLGVYQGASSLARVAGPMYAGLVFVQLGPAVPFVIAAACMLPTLAMVFMLPRHTQAPSLGPSS
ncbi:MAG: MFS transporter [Alphaproteobacteria bacterium]|nr:MFS transporter [Alphaproteobacteria bacterium]